LTKSLFSSVARLADVTEAGRKSWPRKFMDPDSLRSPKLRRLDDTVSVVTSEMHSLLMFNVDATISTTNGLAVVTSDSEPVHPLTARL